MSPVVDRRERWNALSGYLVILLGIAGAAFERGSPPATAPIEDAVAFWSQYSTELVAQSVMFAPNGGAYLWFFGSLRSVLMQAEGGTATLATVVFGAGSRVGSLGSPLWRRWHI